MTETERYAWYCSFLAQAGIQPKTLEEWRGPERYAAEQPKPVHEMTAEDAIAAGVPYPEWSHQVSRAFVEERIPEDHEAWKSLQDARPDHFGGIRWVGKQVAVNAPHGRFFGTVKSAIPRGVVLEHFDGSLSKQSHDTLQDLQQWADERTKRGRPIPADVQAKLTGTPQRYAASSDGSEYQGPQFTLKKTKRGDGLYYGIMVGKDRVGHIGGFEQPYHMLRDGKGDFLADESGKPRKIGPHFDMTNTEVQPEFRGTGLYQQAVKQVASMYPAGLRSDKFQSSLMLHKALRKMPELQEAPSAFLVPGSDGPHDFLPAGSDNREFWGRHYTAASDTSPPQRYSMTAGEIEAALKDWVPPTEAEKEAGNYRKPKIRWHGLTISIENPKGTRRKPEWPMLKFPYGYFNRTEARDSEPVDCWIGPHPESEIVFVVDQENASGRYDEPKVMIGWTNQEDAKDAYLANYTKGWRCGPITALTVPQFKAWLEHGDTTQRIAEQVSRYTQLGKPEHYAVKTTKGVVSQPPQPSGSDEHGTYFSHPEHSKVYLPQTQEEFDRLPAATAYLDPDSNKIGVKVPQEYMPKGPSEKAVQTLEDIRKRLPRHFPKWAAERGVYPDEPHHVENVDNYLRTEHGINVRDDGLIEFDRLTPRVQKLVGGLPVVVYQHTSDALLPSIRKRGLLPAGGGRKATNPHLNSKSGVYVTTETSGKVVDGYRRMAEAKHGGNAVTLAIKSHLHELAPDPDDQDLDWAVGRQFILPQVHPQHILNLDDPDKYAMRFQPDRYVEHPAVSPDHPDHPKFKAWFGDSKVTHPETGKPLVVYHGTHSEPFDAFEHGKPQANPYLLKSDHGLGFFFATDHGVKSDWPEWTEAAGFAGTHTEPDTGKILGPERARIIPAYLSIRAPYRFGWSEYTDAIEKAGSPEMLREQLEALGYDGVIRMSPNKKHASHFIAFYPHQIKSATTNQGTWSKSDDRIAYTAASGTAAAAESYSRLPAEGRHPQETWHNSAAGPVGAEAVGGMPRGVDQADVDRYRQYPLDEQRGIVAVDLDGTLARYDHWQGEYHIGEPIPEMVNRVKQWLAAGRDVRIFTARVYGPNAEAKRRVIEDWCRRYIGRVLPITCQKDPEMTEIWDDRAIQVLQNTGQPVGRFTQEGEPDRYSSHDPSRVLALTDDESEGAEQVHRGFRDDSKFDDASWWTPERDYAESYGRDVQTSRLRDHALDLVDEPQDELVTISDPADIQAMQSAASKLRRHPNRDMQRIGENLADRLDHYNRLQRMDITSAPELRAAMREYLTVRKPAEKEDPIKKKERALIGRKIDDFFPTPRPLIDQMLDAADIKPGMSILEPSAGKGDILDAVTERYPEAQTHAIEPVHDLRDILEAKGHTLVDHDFIKHDAGRKYDRIVMNPPFGNGQDMAHVRKAWEHLKPGGRLVAIMAGGAGRKRDEFDQWISANGGQIESLPEGSFNTSEAFRQTGVNTKMVVMDKPGAEDEPPAVEKSTIRASNDAIRHFAKSLYSAYYDRMLALQGPERYAGSEGGSAMKPRQQRSVPQLHPSLVPHPDAHQKFLSTGQATAFRIHDGIHPMPERSKDTWNDDEEYMPGVSGYANLSNAVNDLLFGDKESVTGDNYASQTKMPTIVAMHGKYIDGPGAEVVVPNPRIAAIITKADVEQAYRKHPDIADADRRLPLPKLLRKYRFSPEQREAVYTQVLQDYRSKYSTPNQ